MMQNYDVKKHETITTVCIKITRKNLKIVNNFFV
jgi:hypothetical protein